MKRWIIIIGILITLLGLYQGSKYLTDYNDLTNYGKGYVWGSIFIIILGSSIIIYGVRKKKITIEDTY